MKKLTEKEVFEYEKAFEDGYRTAVRLYKPHHLSVTTENETITYQVKKPL